MYTKKNIDYIILFSKIVAGITIPFILSSLFLYVGERQFIQNIMPAWNDEDFYYNQIKAILSYGQPLGYYGYDGSHAVVGSFGFHGFFILFPYVLFSLFFGLQYNTIALINIGFIALCNLVYIVFYKPDWKQLLCFSVSLFSPLLIFYINTGMMEGENYFFAIIAALLMMYIIENKEQRKYRILLVLLVIWAVLSKVTWVVLVIPCMMILLRNCKKSIIVKGIVSLTVTGISAGIGYFIFVICRADYFRTKSLISLYSKEISSEGYFGGILFILETAVSNVYNTLFTFDVEMMWLNISKLFIVTIMVLSIFFSVMGYKESLFYSIPAIVIFFFIIGVSVMYVGGLTAVRTIYPAAVFSQVFMFLVILKEKKNRISRIYISICYVFLILTFIVKGKYGYDYRTYYNNEDIAYYTYLNDYMSTIQLERYTDDPWINTLAITLDSYPDRIYELFLPTGTGINYYMDLSGELSDLKARYVLLANNNLEDLNALADIGYEIIKNDSETTLLKKY